MFIKTAVQQTDPSRLRVELRRSDVAGVGFSERVLIYARCYLTTLILCQEVINGGGFRLEETPALSADDPIESNGTRLLNVIPM